MGQQEENEKEETILLDARLVGVLHTRAFRAQLENGHEIVAYRPHAEGPQTHLHPGDRVKVRLSPFDLSAGRIVEKETESSGHESKNVSTSNL